MIKSTAQTDEDLLLVKEFIILPLMLDVVERDKKIINSVNLKYPNLYIGYLDSIQDWATMQLNKIRSEFRKRGIKVYPAERTNAYIQAKYRCRGYEHTITLLWELVRVSIEIRMAPFFHFTGVDDKS